MSFGHDAVQHAQYSASVDESFRINTSRSTRAEKHASDVDLWRRVPRDRRSRGVRTARLRPSDTARTIDDDDGCTMGRGRLYLR